MKTLTEKTDMYGFEMSIDAGEIHRVKKDEFHGERNDRA